MRIEAVVAFVFAVSVVSVSTILGCVLGIVVTRHPAFVTLAEALVLGGDAGTTVVAGLTVVGTTLGATVGAVKWTNQFDAVRHLWTRIDGF